MENSHEILNNSNPDHIGNTLSKTYRLHNRKLVSSRSMVCDDPDCTESAAIGAAFCLPSFATAEWGYFICAAGLVAGDLNCCYGG